MVRLALAMAVLLLLSASAFADEGRAEAKAYHELARSAYAKGRFDEALANFKRAYDIAPIPDLLFNIGLCEERLGQLGDAAAAYERYIAAVPDSPDREKLQEHARTLRDVAAMPALNRSKSAPPEPPLAAPMVTRSPPAPAPVAPPPIYRRWWFWTAIAGVVVAGVAVGLGVGLSNHSPQLTFPAVGP